MSFFDVTHWQKRVADLKQQLAAANERAAQMERERDEYNRHVGELNEMMISLAEHGERTDAACAAMREALVTLICVVGLTAFKYEGQRAVLQEAVDAARQSISSSAGTETLRLAKLGKAVEGMAEGIQLWKYDGRWWWGHVSDCLVREDVVPEQASATPQEALDAAKGGSNG